MYMELKKTSSKSIPWWLWLVVLAVVAVLGLCGYVAINAKQLKNEAAVRASYEEQFPNVGEATLTPTQAKIVSLLRAEFATQPAGTKYSQGVSEPWCADFVSWVMNESGLPFANPHSGSWRIPGTMTLRDYFIEQGKWRPYGGGYVPKTGDIAIYDGNGPHGQHTNFVLAYSNGVLTTVGGNEAGAIHRQDHALNDELKVIGFGAL